MLLFVFFSLIRREKGDGALAFEELGRSWSIQNSKTVMELGLLFSKNLLSKPVCEMVLNNLGIEVYY